MTEPLTPGSKAPSFSLPQDGGGQISLSDFAGQNLVLYFYPRADTPGCTREAQAFSKPPEPNTRWLTQIAGASPPSGKWAFVEWRSARF